MRDHGMDRRAFLGGAIAAGLGGMMGRASRLFAMPRLRAAADLLAATSMPGRPGLSGEPVHRSPAPGPFNILVLGDSYAWQPGLLPAEKSWFLVTQHITSVLAGFREVTPPRVFARSGAVIGEADYGAPFAAKDSAAPWPGDVPDVFWDDAHPGGDTGYAAPSMWEQLRRAQSPRGRGYVDPRQVALVLVSGGGNDVAVTNIVAPRPGPNHHAEFRQWIDTLCGDRMKRFLPAVANAFPDAKIVVTGYPQVVSDSTDSWALGRYLGALGVTVGGAIAATGGVVTGIALAALASPIVKALSAAQSAAFADESSRVLQEAVNQVNAAHGGTRAVFVDVRTTWDATHAYGAPGSYLWPFTAPGDPPDHTAAARRAMCATHGQVAGVPTDLECVQGAMGHPNVEGAQAYAEAVGAALDSFGAGWPGNGPLALTVDRVARTATTRTVNVHARDRNGQAVAATVAIYGVTGPTDAPLTYPATPPTQCMEVLMEGGEHATDPRGKPLHLGKAASREVNVCAGTVTRPGYQAASFAP